MDNNIITEDNLAIIKDLIPNIVYNELMGNLEITEMPTDKIEPIVESDEVIKARSEIQDLTELLDLVEGNDKKKIKKEIEDLKELINVLTEK